ncbi:MAG TPA: hypothetical protein VD789_13890, partial [Thermomicrobiales bacterium]|nr:hypothetical protein [Thermomicrobiales bacterium]
MERTDADRFEISGISERLLLRLRKTSLRAARGRARLRAGPVASRPLKVHSGFVPTRLRLRDTLGVLVKSSIG